MSLLLKIIVGLILLATPFGIWLYLINPAMLSAIYTHAIEFISKILALGVPVTTIILIRSFSLHKIKKRKLEKIYFDFLIAFIRDYLNIKSDEATNEKSYSQHIDDKRRKLEQQIDMINEKVDEQVNKIDKILSWRINNKKLPIYIELIEKLFKESDREVFKKIIDEYESEILALATNLNILDSVHFRDTKKLIDCFKSLKNYYDRDIFYYPVRKPTQNNEYYQVILIYTDTIQKSSHDRKKLVDDYIHSQKLKPYDPFHEQKLLQAEYINMNHKKERDIWVIERTVSHTKLNILGKEIYLRYNTPRVFDIWIEIR